MRLYSLCLLLVACDPAPSAQGSDYAPLLTNAVDGVISPALTRAASEASALDAAALAFESDPSKLAAAQQAWRSARAAWRALDAVHFGPVDDLGIAERIDVAPASASEIAAITGGSAAIDAATIGNAGGHAKGFLGLEAVLFAAQAPSARERTYARFVASEIASSVSQLHGAWDDYAGQVKNAGGASTRYATQRAAVDDLVAGVSYALELVAGVRLAAPLGKKTTGMPMPSADPTPLSDSGVADMSASLATVSALYAGAGFSSRVAPKSRVLDERCKSQLDACIQAVAAIPAPFVTSVTSNTAVVESAYEACKTFKATWNTDATSALGATLKPSDNDGD